MDYLWSLIRCGRVTHIHTLLPLWKVLNEWEIIFFLVRHTIEEMDFRWKEEEPITLFNEELAEFDVVKFEVESKKASYVSGKVKFVILFLIPFWHCSFENPRTEAKATTLMVLLNFRTSLHIFLTAVISILHSFRTEKHNFCYNAGSWWTIRRISKEILLWYSLEFIRREHCRNLS